MQNSVFRKTSLERIASPEQLNQYIRVGGPAIWCTLGGLIILMLSVAVWSIFGRIPDTVSAKGIVFPQNGIVDVIPAAGGKISDMRVKSGDYVETGRILLIIPQEDLIEKINKLKADRTADVGKLEKIKAEYGEKSVIIAPVQGVVLSAMKTGEKANEEEPVVRIIREDKYSDNKQVICYIPAAAAKRLSVGMEVQVSPDFAPREEYGYMVGSVLSVGKYPVTADQVNSALDGLPKPEGILPEDSSIEVRINLTADPASEDLIKWSGVKGQKFQVGFGTSCNVVVIVKKHRPLEMIFGGNQGE